jgi:hypothetical protein
MDYTNLIFLSLAVGLVAFPTHRAGASDAAEDPA